MLFSRLPCMFLLALILSNTSLAASFAVTSSANNPDAIIDGVCADSGGNCTLRAAIQEANVLIEPSFIDLQVSADATGAAQEQAGVDGDLDIYGNITIVGQGRDVTEIDAGGVNDGLDRVFEIHPGAILTLKSLTVTGGDVRFAELDERASNLDLNSGLGGGIYNKGTLFLDDVAVKDNCVLGVGGGIHSDKHFSSDVGSHTEIINSVISDNQSCSSAGPANVNGAGISAQNVKSVIIKNSIIENNMTPTNIAWNRVSLPWGGVLGGGIFFLSDGELYIENTLIQGHWSMDGGGIYFGLGKLTIINSTIQGNFARRNGGGLYFLRDQVGDSRFIDRATPHLINVTLANNGAGGHDNLDDGACVNCFGGGETGGILGGGGLFVSAEAGVANSFRISNTIVSNNRLHFDNDDINLTSSENCRFVDDAVLHSFGGNLADDASCIFTPFVNGDIGPFRTDQSNTDPLLLPLAFNGGFNDTLAIPAVSPAVDTAEPSFCPSADQRGYARDGADCDVGAYEASAAIPAPQVFPQVYAVHVGGITAGTLGVEYGGPGEVTVEVTTQPTKGELTFNIDEFGVLSTDDFIYTHNPATTGNDSLVYIACADIDGVSLCSEPATIEFAITTGFVPNVAQINVIVDGGAVAQVSNVAIINDTDLSAEVSDVDFDFPLGVIFFTLQDVDWNFNAGRPAVRVTLEFPETTTFPLGAEVRKMDKFGDWHTIGTLDDGTTFDLDNFDKPRVQVTILDNDMFDNNELVNVINDPIAIGVPKGRNLSFSDLQRDTDAEVTRLTKAGNVPGGIGGVSIVLMMMLALRLLITLLMMAQKWRLGIKATLLSRSSE